MVSCLLSNGADLLAVNGDGDLPIDTAEGDKVINFLNEEIARRGEYPFIRIGVPLYRQSNYFILLFYSICISCRS